MSDIFTHNLCVQCQCTFLAYQLRPPVAKDSVVISIETHSPLLVISSATQELTATKASADEPNSTTSSVTFRVPEGFSRAVATSKSLKYRGACNASRTGPEALK
ncbi:hypothetical protein EYF80_017413 [Liparis tanakae]|uniref:Uncharacterized protein n=1 Tax=Liparis tanakae TaxID=230148 RepID=A0A4Z2I4Z9_9TELE|nr:hypothetical protein EYF80_017413 [Liparis tanakae]